MANKKRKTYNKEKSNKNKEKLRPNEIENKILKSTDVFMDCKGSFTLN